VVTPNQLPTPVIFGPFKVNTSTGELLNGSIRVRLSAQPFAILLLLLKNPGELVTRDQLRDQIWKDGVFVDFEHGLNSAINKLRSALGDSVENPRYIETIPGRGYRFIGKLDSGDVEPIRPLDASEAPEEGQPRWHIVAVWERPIWAVGAIVCLALGLRFHNLSTTQPNFTFTRITAHAGLSGYPTLSPDGTLMAYSSDGGLNGEQDLYVRQVAGGQPIRLTFDNAGNTMPDFSPDGTKIVFRSNRDSGGIFEIPTLGGEARLLARAGLNPKYSPDGSQVVYWVGTEGIASAVPGSGAVWVVPVTGGSPRRIGGNFSAARQPIWLPDGKRLLFVGYTSTKAYEYSALDWWVVAINGGAGIKTGLYDELVRNGLTSTSLRSSTRIPYPGCWQAGDNKVIFSLGTGEQADLWEIGLSPRTSRVNGAPKRLTAGTVRELYPTCARGGTLAFAGVETTSNVWSFAFDLDRGRPTSDSTLERVTTGPSLREYASIASDGRLLAFASNQSGQTNIWTRDLMTGKEAPLASSSMVQRYPVSSPSGNRIAFSVFEKDSRAVYVSAPGGPSERICDGCLRATDWSRDEKRVLIFGGNPYQIDTLDVASHQQTPILKHPNHSLLYGRFSPDGRWVSFTVRIQPGQARIVIAPANELKPIPESAWITIAESTDGDWANWSPDGRTIYFSSTRDGHSCFWGQRIEALSHRPVGEPFPALHLHGRVYYQAGTVWGGWSVGGGRIAMVLAEDTGNIWMMSPLRSR
jgi:Tol biopolymer transport system component/DNA-binding winged helix-turn-helix (wHTH) protein